MTYRRVLTVEEAAEMLVEQIGFPGWLSGVSPMLDPEMGTTVIEVAVIPGVALPRLPAKVAGYPVRMVRCARAVPYDRSVARSAGRKRDIPKPYPPGTRYGLLKRANLITAGRSDR